MSVLFPFKLAAKLLSRHGNLHDDQHSPPPESAASVGFSKNVTSAEPVAPPQILHSGGDHILPPTEPQEEPVGQCVDAKCTHFHACRSRSLLWTGKAKAQTGWGANGVDNVSPKKCARGIRNQLHDTIIPPPTHTHAMANETAGNSTKDEDGGPARVNPWVQYYLDSTAAALWTRPTHVADNHQVPGPNGAHACASLISANASAGVDVPVGGGCLSSSSEQLLLQAQPRQGQVEGGRAAPIITCSAPVAPTATVKVSVAPSSRAGVISPLALPTCTFSGSSTSSSGGPHVQSRSAFLLNQNQNTSVLQRHPLPLSATAQALLSGSTPTLTPSPGPTSHTPPIYYYPTYHQAMYYQQHPTTGPIPAHSPPSAAHQPAFYHHHHHPPPPPPPPPQSHPTYQPPQYQHYPTHHHPPTMYYSTAPAPSPPLAPSPLFPPTTPPPHSASPTHFAPHQHSPTWPPPSPTSTDPTTSAPPAQLNPTNYLLSLASISLAVLQPFLFYQATGSPSASAALRRSTPAALVPKAITSVLITLFISCVMIPAFLTATAVAWARSGKQQALRDMREVVLVVHSRWMGDDLKHITRPLAQGLTLLGNVIEHAPSVRLTPGMIRAAIQGVGPSTGLRDQVVQRVMRVAATGAPNVAVLVHYLSPLIPRQALASVVAAVLSAAGGSPPVPMQVPVPVVGGEGSAIHEVRAKEKSPRTHRKSKTSGESGKSPKKRKSATAAGSSKASSGSSSRASDSGSRS